MQHTSMTVNAQSQTVACRMQVLLHPNIVHCPNNLQSPAPACCHARSPTPSHRPCPALACLDLALLSTTRASRSAWLAAATSRCASPYCCRSCAISPCSCATSASSSDVWREGGWQRVGQ